MNGTVSLKRFHWEVNRYCYIENTLDREPALVTLYKAQNTSAIHQYINYTRADKNDGFDPISKIYPIKLNSTVEVVFQLMTVKGATQMDVHPWHLHGQDFYDLGLGKGKFTDEKLTEILSTRNPIHRDTTVGFAEIDNEMETFECQNQVKPLANID